LSDQEELNTRIGETISAEGVKIAVLVNYDGSSWSKANYYKQAVVFLKRAARIARPDLCLMRTRPEHQDRVRRALFP
jgi:hypothetical protein